MKPRITARSLRRWWLLVLALLGLTLAACTGVRLTVATAVPAAQLTFTAASAPDLPLTQTAERVPTRYITATPARRPPTATAEPMATPEFQPTSAEKVYSSSPDGRYFIRCVEASYLHLYRTDDEQPIWEFASHNIACYSIQWAKNAPVVGFVLLKEPEYSADVYIWREGDAEPRLVYRSQRSVYSHLWWSLDGGRLILLEESLSREDFAFLVIYGDGRPLLWVDAHVPVDVLSVEWVSTNVFLIQAASGACCSISMYFDANTGKQFPAWHNGFGLSQPPAYSPDLRWRITDNSHRAWRGDPYASMVYFVHDYGLLNFESARYDELVNGENQYLQFVGWTEDNAKFYLVSRPATADALSVPNIPFGLLALNPLTREFQQLFEQAVFAKLSPDKKLVWVVFPAKHADGALGLDGGIFNLADGTLAGRLFVSDRVLYGNPAEGDLVPVAWSNDGTRVVFGDSQGNLTLMKTDGTTQSLATNLPLAGWPGNVHYAWSPDDRHLLVQSGNRAWIVTVP